MPQDIVCGGRATINYPGSNNFTSFTYDGQGNRVKIVETTGGSTTSTKQFIFAQGDMCEARDTTGSTVLGQFYDYGESNGTSFVFSTHDHLSSVRELCNAAGSVVANYLYDSYGQVTRVIENFASDFLYGGYYVHARSGLYMTTYREYNASLARWLSRDPIGSTSRYDYVSNVPIGSTDSLGLYSSKWYKREPEAAHAALFDQRVRMIPGPVKFRGKTYLKGWEYGGLIYSTDPQKGPCKFRYTDPQIGDLPGSWGADPDKKGNNSAYEKSWRDFESDPQASRPTAWYHTHPDPAFAEFSEADIGITLNHDFGLTIKNAYLRTASGQVIEFP